MAKFIASAIFDTEAEANRALGELRQAGVEDSSLSVIARHDGKNRTTSGSGEVTDEGGSNLLRGLLGGGALGAGLGVAALAIPGVGPLAAAGVIAASVVPEAMAVGAVAGAAAGGLNENLKKHGVNEEDSVYYGERIETGSIFIAVDTTAENISEDQALDILYRNGGHSSSREKSTLAHM
ncbi:hypothetical protein FHS79_001804 [Polymorphobacter multimanifer]|uniref:DUF1269 domain-containing protein n=1 Tax=Polymorphobacter multimanifer TaxID=1070431 RepID=A0A841LCU7_9SPHN|nr:hypothetical protein [Polymorphobacter multimanifer]MBB6227635.1 hypothetical protein [Polymorphobacter multimanifer]